MVLYLSSPGSFFLTIILVLILKVDSRSYSIIPSRCLLAYHFFSVAFYSIWVMFTHTRTIPSSPNGHSNGNAKPHSTKPQFNQYPALLLKSVRVVRLSISEYLQHGLFLNILFLVLDSLCSVRSAIMDGNTSVISFELV